MASKNPLSKFRNRPTFSFRFNPNEEDLLEELTNTEATELEPVLSSSLDNLKESCNLDEQESTVIANSESLSNSSSQSEVITHTQSEKSSRDASPLKESAKEYLSRVGKRSASLDYVPSDSERWSLSGIKGRIAKRFEEISKDAPAFAGNLVRGSSLSGEKHTKLKESTSANGVNEQKSRDSSPVTPSLTSRSRSSLDVRLAARDELDPAVGDKVGDRSISVEEGIDCTESGEHKNRTRSLSGELNSLGTKQNPKSSQTIKVLSSTTKYCKGILEADSVSLSALKATRSFESELLVADETEDGWEFLDSQQAVEEMPETPLVFENKHFPDNSTTESAEEPTTLSQQAWALLMSRHAGDMDACKRPAVSNLVLTIMAAILAVHLAPLTSYFTGLLTGFLLSYLLGRAIFWIFNSTAQPKEPIRIPDYDKLPPLRIPVPDIRECDAAIAKGWMNQLSCSKYDPESYNVSQTHSIYVRLEGTQLRLSRPKVNISRRAMWNETKPTPIFTDQKHYKLQKASVTLPPDGLAKKRLWSKKYPICLNILINTSQTNYDEDKNLLSNSDDEKSSNSTVTIYLFARTCREKEEWYRRFYVASTGKTPNSLFTSFMESPQKESNSSIISTEMTDFSSVGSSLIGTAAGEEELCPTNYANYMAKYVSQENVFLNVDQSSHIEPDETKEKSDLWLNALIGRIFYDFLMYPSWADLVAERIQKKLSVIKVPYFMDELRLKDINLGPNLPLMHRSSPPLINQRGLWIDFDLTYNGTFQMTLETKLNLMRLKKDQQQRDANMRELTTLTGVKSYSELDLDSSECSPPTRHSNKSYLYNSDEEDSAESSSDDDISTTETPECNTPEDSAGAKASTSKKFLHWVDKITSSRYFQQATEIGYIKKAMAGVSKTPIVLTVEVRGLCGTLAINIPPPPTDRLWYGFRNNPQLSLTARPKLGEHVVTLTHITDWIEKKLTLEFQKVLVMPNMDDLVIPIMEPAYSQQPGYK